MKLIKAFALFLALSTCSAFSAEENSYFLRGILDLGENRAFSLSDSEGKSSGWVKIGQSFNGYQLTEYDPEARVLVLQNEDERIELGMAAVTQGRNADGTPEERLAEAERMMNLMNFEQMINDTLDAQMDAMSSMMTQQLEKMGQNDEDFIQFQQKIMREMFADIDWKPIQTGMTEAYAEVFTKEELEGMSNFYTTPAGKATITKMPEIQQKSMQVMMPAIMEASQSMQAKMIEYIKNKQPAAEPAAEPAAAAPAAEPAAAAPAAE